MTSDRLVQAGSLVALVAVWAFVSAAVGRDIIPGPAAVAPAVARLITTGQFASPLFESLVRTITGFGSGFVVGVAVGIAAAKRPWFSLTASPLISIALFAPTLIIIYLGIAMMGRSLTSFAVIDTLVIFPIVAIYMRDVIRNLDQDILDMADSFRVVSWQRIRDVYLPYLVPPMLGASRIAFSLSWKVVMLAEVFGFSGGLGFQIRIQYGIYNLTALLAWLMIFVVALLVAEQLLRALEKAVVKWQP